MRTFAIGDIHGCLSQFQQVLEVLTPGSEDHLILLGDLIDRGPKSAGVIKRAIGLSTACHLTVIKGNHEQMMLDARTCELDAIREWLFKGGETTLQSYAGERATLRDVDPDHWRFLETALVDYLETDTHIFVHANAYPDHAMAKQPDYMLRWERCDKIVPHDSGKVIICGHTPQKSRKPMNKGFAICVDTGCGHGGPLTAMDISSGKIFQASSTGEITRAHISDFTN